MPYRQSLWRTDITIVGIGALGPADKWEGAEKDSDSSMYPRAGGDVKLGGRATRDEGTATYLYDEFLHSVWKRLDRGCGTLRAIITRTPTADDGTPFPGGGFTLTGVLKGCTLPEGTYDSNDGAEAELVFDVDTEFA